MSDECKKYTLWQQKKGSMLVSIVVSAVFLIPVILAAIYWDIIALLFALPLAAFPWLNLLPPSKKDEGLFVPEKIVIDADESTLAWESDKSKLLQYMEEVEEVSDMGGWYTIHFRHEIRTPPFVCEKNLLCQGTFEEFEKLFGEKLVKPEQ